MKLNNKQTILVGFAFMAICAFWQVYDSIIPLILKNTFCINDTISGVIMALDNVLALVLLPLFGSWSDKVNTRLGRRMPFVLVGTLLACAFTILLPLGDNRNSLALFLVGLGGVLLSMAVFRSPAVALMPDVTPKPLRSKANAIINLTGTIGGILMLAAIAVLVPKTGTPNYLPLFAFLILFMLLCLAVLLWKVNEPKLHEKMLADSAGLPEDPAEAETADTGLSRSRRRSLLLILASIFLWYMGYNAITTSFSKYCVVYWGLTGGSFAYTLIIAQAAAIIAYIPVGILATRIGRRKTILIGVALLTIAFGSCVFFRTWGSIIFFFFVLAGFGWAGINVNSYPMVVEMSQGSDVGKYTGYYYTVSMLAQIITPILSGALLEYGYLLLGSADPNAGYLFLFPYGAFFAGCSFITMLFVRHGDSAAAAKDSVLEAFDVED